jgi:hypothetical protein
MTAEQIIYALRSGRALVMRDRGTAEEEATLTYLYERGLLYVDADPVRGVVIFRWRKRQKRYVRVRVIEPTWYGWRVSEKLMEVE